MTVEEVMNRMLDTDNHGSIHILNKKNSIGVGFEAGITFDYNNGMIMSNHQWIDVLKDENVFKAGEFMKLEDDNDETHVDYFIFYDNKNQFKS